VYSIIVNESYIRIYLSSAVLSLSTVIAVKKRFVCLIGLHSALAN